MDSDVGVDAVEPQSYKDGNGIDGDGIDGVDMAAGEPQLNEGDKLAPAALDDVDMEVVSTESFYMKDKRMSCRKSDRYTSAHTLGFRQSGKQPTSASSSS